MLNRQETFESQLEDLVVRGSYMENAMGSTSAVSTPPERVELLMQKIADKGGMEIAVSVPLGQN